MTGADMIQVPEFLSREAGFEGAAVRITKAVWDDCIAWDKIDGLNTGIPQDEDGRLWDVLYMTRRCLSRLRDDSQVVLHRWARDTDPAVFESDNSEPPLVELRAIRSTADGNTTITIMLPCEDPGSDYRCPRCPHQH